MTQQTENLRLTPYGPGKYNLDIDCYIHSMDADEQAGDVEEPYGWYGLYRGPLPLDYDQDFQLKPDDRRFLESMAGGAIANENSDGFVSVEYFATEAELETAWAEVQAKLDAETNSEPQADTDTEDIEVHDNGSITSLEGITPRGKAWLKENLETESWQWNGPCLAVEPRMAEDIVEGALEAGLTVAR